jgi:hypothetical protein
MRRCGAGNQHANRNGRPRLRFEGRTQQDMNAAGVTGAHVTLSHDGDYATAFVVLERDSAGNGGGGVGGGGAGGPQEA